MADKQAAGGAKLVLCNSNGSYVSLHVCKHHIYFNKILDQSCRRYEEIGNY